MFLIHAEPKTVCDVIMNPIGLMQATDPVETQPLCLISLNLHFKIGQETKFLIMASNVDVVFFFCCDLPYGYTF